MKKYIESHEEYQVSPLTISPNHNAWPSKLLQRLLGGIKSGENTFCIHEDYGLKFYADKDAWNKASDYVIENFRVSSRLIKKVERESEKIAKQTLKYIYLATHKNIKRWPNKQLAKYLTKTYQLANDFCAYGYIPLISDHYFNKFTHVLKNIARVALERRDVRGSAPEIVQLLSSPTKSIPSRLARKDLLELALKLKKLGKPEMSQIKKYYECWYWVNNGQLGPELTLEAVLEELKKLIANKSVVKKELALINSEYLEIKKQQNAAFKKIDFTTAEKRLFETAQIGTYLKGLRMEVLFGVYAAWGRILEEMSGRVKISKDLLYYCSMPELVRWLTTGQRVLINVLKERAKFCVWVAVSETKQIILTGAKAREYVKQHAAAREIGNRDALVIHGSVASLGYAKGAVKIVNKTSDINKVEAGDILVSVATNPSLLPAMYKAAGFVTDAGGITSHAAIVAREMKKPCIIGTKIASKVLKDGELVELDTKKGDVRIISR